MGKGMRKKDKNTKSIKYKKIKCPLCGGTGFYCRKYNQNAIIIPNLRDRGLTYREIMKATGLKSLDTIHYYLKRKKSWRYPEN